jgi:hypothetical protein
MRQRSVGQHDLLFEHVIDRLPVEDRSRTGRVVRHHAADGGAARGRDVRREAQVVGTQRRVQLVQYDARLDADPALSRVHLEDAVEVLRRVDNEAAADRLPGLRRATAPHRQRTAVFRADGHRLDHIVPGFGDDHAERLDLVDAGVGGIERA